MTYTVLIPIWISILPLTKFFLAKESLDCNYQTMTNFIPPPFLYALQIKYPHACKINIKKKTL